MKPAFLQLSALLAASFAAVGSGCTDPVRDAAIEALGEDQVEPNADHRPGQPCLLCHSDGGPASSKAFAIAGTVFASREPGAKGAENVIVQFKDARGGQPVVPAITGPSGNFYVPIADWPNIAFPIRVGLYAESVEDPPTIVMKSLINREGSCNFCHRPNLDPKDLPDDEAEKEKALQATAASAGQLYMP